MARIGIERSNSSTVELYWANEAAPKKDLLSWHKCLIFLFAIRGFYLFRNGCNLFWRWINFHQVRVNPLKMDTWGPLSLSHPQDGYGGGTAHPTEGSLIKYELHIRMYYFQPQKYLPKNQGSRSTGQKENSHSPKSWRRPGHTPRAGHDGVFYHDVLSPGNHPAAVLHAKVISLQLPWPHTLCSSWLTVDYSFNYFYIFFSFGQHMSDSAFAYPSINYA